MMQSMCSPYSTSSPSICLSVSVASRKTVELSQIIIIGGRRGGEEDEAIKRCEVHNTTRRNERKLSEVKGSLGSRGSVL